MSARNFSQASRVPVLMYHRVGQASNAWEERYAISPENFAAHRLTSRAVWQR